MTTYKLCASDDSTIGSAGSVSTREFSADHIDDVLENVKYFLQGVGFVLDGTNITLTNEETVYKVAQEIETVSMSAKDAVKSFVADFYNEFYIKITGLESDPQIIHVNDLMCIIESLKTKYLQK